MMLHPIIDVNVAMQTCAAAQPASTLASAKLVYAQLPGLGSAASQGVSQSHPPM